LRGRRPHDLLPADLLLKGQHATTVCNACRYCEQYCPVFPALEQRLTFQQGDLTYLANLCHNCGECLYACQYAPPHEFGIDLPRTFAEIRLASYEEYCWPRFLARGFRHQLLLTTVAIVSGLMAVVLASTWALGPSSRGAAARPGDFYAVVPHAVMVGLFGGASLFVATAIAVGVLRFSRDVRESTARGVPGAPAPRLGRAFRDALTLRHLHSTGDDCTAAQEARSPWRRWLHHCTFYGFLLCVASTSVAAVYHNGFGWVAPYAYTSLPVLLGTMGGAGLIVGPAGLLWLRRQRDPALTDPAQHALDESFMWLLLASSATGFGLLILRDGALMTPLLILHLGVVLALFVTLPYGKFVHGFYRMGALIKYAREGEHSAGARERRAT
jgi:citrate/tricarballylate utilization protein